MLYMQNIINEGHIIFLDILLFLVLVIIIWHKHTHEWEHGWNKSSRTRSAMLCAEGGDFLLIKIAWPIHTTLPKKKRCSCPGLGWNRQCHAIYHRDVTWLHSQVIISRCHWENITFIFAVCDCLWTVCKDGSFNLVVACARLL